MEMENRFMATLLFERSEHSTPLVIACMRIIAECQPRCCSRGNRATKDFRSSGGHAPHLRRIEFADCQRMASSLMAPTGYGPPFKAVRFLKPEVGGVTQAKLQCSLVFHSGRVQALGIALNRGHRTAAIA